MVVVCGKEVTGTMNTGNQHGRQTPYHLYDTRWTGTDQRIKINQKRGLPGDTETGGTRFASIAFGYQTHFGENPNPRIQKEHGKEGSSHVKRRSNDRRSH